jgi:hypothetical protein
MTVETLLTTISHSEYTEWAAYFEWEYEESQKK